MGLDNFAICKFEPVHAEGEHLWWLDDPVRLPCLSFGSLIDFIAIDSVSKGVFPCYVEVLLVCYLKHHIADGRVLTLLIRVTILVLVLDLSVSLANES